MNEIDYKEVGKRIKIARIKYGISQEKLAEKVNISIPHMSNLETGNSSGSLPTFIAIANALDTTLDSLFSDVIINSNHVLKAEIAELLEDCNVYEMRVLTDILKETKNTLRKYKYFK